MPYGSSELKLRCFFSATPKKPVVLGVLGRERERGTGEREKENGREEI